MGIHDNAGGAVERAEDHVGGLASHARQLDEFLKRARDLSRMFLNDRLACADDVLRLVLVEAAGLDVLLDFFDGRIDVMLRGIEIA